MKNNLPQKEILLIRGIMVCASATYKFMSPYLNGIYLSIEVWRPTIHSSGWAIEKEDYEYWLDYASFNLLDEKGIEIILPPP